MRKNRKSISMSKLTSRRTSRLGVELFQLFLLPYKNRVEAKIGWETCRGVGLVAQKGAKAHFWSKKRLRRGLPRRRTEPKLLPTNTRCWGITGGDAPAHARPCGGFFPSRGPVLGQRRGRGRSTRRKEEHFLST